MKRNNKKGFTIVELVIVIAVIAILAAVLIPTFGSIIKKANVSKDTQLVRNLNTALVIDGNKHNTMTDALEAAKESGYDVGRINVSATNSEILWDSVNDVFCYFDGEEIVYIPEAPKKKEVSKYQYFVIRDVKTNSDISSLYSTYIRSYELEETAITTTKGLDVGEVSGIESVTYTNTGDSQDVIIRTNSASTDIVLAPFVDSTDNTKGDHIEFYGKSGQIVGPKDDEGNYTGFTVAFNSLAINGETFGIKVASGHVDLTNAVVEEDEEIIILATTTDVKVSNPNKVATHAHATSSDNADTMNDPTDAAKKSVGVTWDYDNDFDFETAVEEVVEEKVAEEIAEKQAACKHEFNDDNVCVKCGLKQAPTDAKLVEQGYVIRVVGGDGYMSLQEGMLALNNGDTLKVLQDITLTQQTSDGLSAQKCTIDLNGKTITASNTWKLSNTVEKFNEDHYLVGMTENPVDVTIMNGTYIVNGTDSGTIRFEKASTARFENVTIKSSSETKTYQGLLTYACNNDGKIEKNTYSFNNCSFENVYLKFGGASGSCNRYDISFKDCIFDSTTSANGYNQIYIDSYNYGDLTIDSCEFKLVGNAGGAAANCFYIDTYLSYTSGKIVNVNVVNSTFDVSGKANPYSQRFMNYNNNYMDNSSIAISNTTFTKDGKTVETVIKETSATSKQLMWVENAEAFTAAYEEYKKFAVSGTTGYNSTSYYVVECNGYYFVAGQGTQFMNGNPVITYDAEGKITQVTISGIFTYKKVGDEDLSVHIDGEDDANVKIYLLTK